MVGLIIAILFLIIPIVSRDVTTMNVLPIISLFILIVSVFGLMLFSISTAYAAYKMDETLWAILCIVAIAFHLLLFAPVVFKTMKTQELLSEKK